MLNKFKKQAVYALIFGISTNFCTTSYAIPFSAFFKKSPKIVKPGPIKQFFKHPATIAAMIFSSANLIQIIQKKLSLIGCKNASEKTKQQILAIAKKLKLKNPEKINIKVLDQPQKNAFATATGDILISKEFDQDPESDENKFAFGHELTHLKEKHVLKGMAVSICTYGLLTAAFCLASNKIQQNLKSLQKVPYLGKILEKISKIPLAIKSYLLCNFFSYPTAIITANTFWQIAEKQADVGAAHLGKDYAKGGIQILRGFEAKMETERKKKSPFMNKVNNILIKLLDPHPSNKTRIKYLKEFAGEDF